MTHVNLLALQKQAAIRSPETLLDHALPLIVSQLDSVIAAEVFRMSRGGMVLWHGENSTSDNGAFIALEAHSPQQQAILQQEVVRDADVVVAPIIHNKDTFALLVLKLAGDLNLDDVAVMAEELGLLLYAQELNVLLEKQIAVTGRLSIASSLVDVATVIAQTMVQQGQFISVNILNYDAHGEVIGGRVIATANRKDAFPSDIPLKLDILALRDLYVGLLQDGELLISDIDTEERFSDAGKAWFREQKIKSMFNLPLWIEGELHAFISLSDTSRVLALSKLEKELLHNVAQQAANTIEKQRLLEKTQRSVRLADEQVRMLSLLNDLIAQANSNQIEIPILQQMADMLLDVSGVDHVGVVMREGDTAVVVSEAPAAGLIGRSIELGAHSIHAVLEETRKPFVALDVANNMEMPQGTRDALLDAEVQSVIVVPIFDENDDLLGSVGLDYFSKQASIDPNIVQAAQTIVNQVALSLQKLRLLAEAQQKAEQLERLTEFGQSLRTHLSVEEILTATLEYSPEVMQSDYVGVLLHDRATNTIRQNALHFHDDNNIKLEGKSITPEDNSIALEAWSRHDLVKVDDLHADWAWKHHLHRELQSIMAIPLSLAGVTLGVLEVGSVSPHHFNETDVTTLRQISNQLAIALSNASAYSQSQRLARNKTQANDIIAKLQEQLEVGDILNITVNELGKAIGAKRARIRLGSAPTKSVGES